MTREAAIQRILSKREAQDAYVLKHTGDPDFDKKNSRNDWIAYAAAYLGRAADKCFINEEENQSYQENILKVAALCLAALENCQE